MQVKLVGGLLTLGGTLNVTGLAGFGAGRYDLIDYPTANTAYVLGNDSLALGSLPSRYNYLLDNTTPGQIDLVMTPAIVPEPSDLVFVVASAVLWLGLYHVRRYGRIKG